MPQYDENIMINGCSLLRADHPSNSKRRGVFVLQRVFTIIIQECLVTEIIVDNENVFSHASIDPQIKIMRN